MIQLKLFLWCGFFLLFSNLAFSNETLECITSGAEADLIRVKDKLKLASYESWIQCEQVREASHGGVVCAWFTPGMPIGPGGWQETGWRPMNIETKVGLGRKAISELDTCLGATKNANGGVVCTYTGLGFKPTNINTNMWCGSSSQHQYCTMATAHASDLRVCSFPTSGTGSEEGWILTTITSSCNYQGGKSSLENCSAKIP